MLAALALVLLSGSAAQDLPLPQALVTAKTAAVVNDGVDQDIYDRLVLELRAWKRFTLVEDPGQAEITITINGQHAIASNPVTRQTFDGIAYRLSFKRADTILYSDQLKGCCSLKAMIRKTLERLDKRLRDPRAP